MWHLTDLADNLGPCKASLRISFKVCVSDIVSIRSPTISRSDCTASDVRQTAAITRL